MSKEVRNNASPVPAFQWLDDAQLAELSTAEVEDVLDRYLLSVVQQLVQVYSKLEGVREREVHDPSPFNNDIFALCYQTSGTSSVG